MSARLSLVLSLSVVVGGVAVAPAVVAQDALPEVENSRFQFSGAVNANAVNVRSGPGDNYYPTAQLNTGDQVTVVGIKFDWLKVLPPEGSFSYVAKAFVERRGDGSTGRVTRPDVNVRAGSALNALKTTVQTKLNEGDDVEIIGEADEYFKIKPPAGSYLYIKKQFVDPVRAIGNAPVAQAAVEQAPAQEPGVAGPGMVSSALSITPEEAGFGDPAAAAPAGQEPGAATEVAAEAPVATTQPTAAGEAEFDKVEEQYQSTAALPLDEQPVEEMLKAYESLASGGQIPDSMRRIAERRIAALKVRADARAELAALKKLEEERQAKMRALKAEQEEIAARIKAAEIVTYSAVGTLRTSSLQQGPQTLYRLTDPQSGRTLVYLRGNDAKYVQLIGQFIGVRGDVATDPYLSLQVIEPTAAEIVDPARVNRGVAAQIMPPSLLQPVAPSASTGNE